jgi:hypothetical protein
MIQKKVERTITENTRAVQVLIKIILFQGLGTSTAQEGQEYFEELPNTRRILSGRRRPWEAAAATSQTTSLSYRRQRRMRPPAAGHHSVPLPPATSSVSFSR